MSTEVGFHRISPNIGAEVSCGPLDQLSDAAIAAIKQGLIDFKVLVFRDKQMTPEQHLKFMEPHGGAAPQYMHGGPAYMHHTHRKKQNINNYHMDGSFEEKPDTHLSLFALIIPECGGDTLWSSLEAAYDGLPAPMRERVDALSAIHANDFLVAGNLSGANKPLNPKLVKRAIHPLVCVNPDNCRRYLYVNAPAYFKGIPDMPKDEALSLYTELYHHVHKPEFTMRLRWAEGTMVLWENNHTLHYPCSDYFPLERKLQKIRSNGLQKPLAAARPKL